jgi:hypothetical protein
MLRELIHKTEERDKWRTSEKERQKEAQKGAGLLLRTMALFGANSRNSATEAGRVRSPNAEAAGTKTPQSDGPRFHQHHLHHPIFTAESTDFKSAPAGLNLAASGSQSHTQLQSQSQSESLGNAGGLEGHAPQHHRPQQGQAFTFHPSLSPVVSVVGTPSPQVSLPHSQSHQLPSPDQMRALIEVLPTIGRHAESLRHIEERMANLERLGTQLSTMNQSLSQLLQRFPPAPSSQ